MSRSKPSNSIKSGRPVLKFFAYFGIFLLLVLLVGPFLVPVPPLENTRPAKELADADSQFLRLNGLDVHYKLAGKGEPALVLLHGFASSTVSWQDVLVPLSEPGRTVLAFDRPASGLTARPLSWEGPNPYSPDFQAGLVVGFLDYLGVDQAVLVGNSAGGSIAVHTYLLYPERVKALILVDPAILSGGGAPAWVQPLLYTPQFSHLGPLVSRSLLGQMDSLIDLAYHDPAKMTPERMAGYLRSAQVDDWDKALWQFTLASRDLKLGERLGEIKVPTLVITGDDDRIVPTEQSLQVASQIAGAKLVVIPNCGHVPQEECQPEFLQAVNDFLK